MMMIKHKLPSNYLYYSFRFLGTVLAAAGGLITKYCPPHPMWHKRV